MAVQLYFGEGEKNNRASDRPPQPKVKIIKSREKLIAMGICVACQQEKASKFSPLGKNCLYKFSAIEAKARKGMA